MTPPRSAALLLALLASCVSVGVALGGDGGGATGATGATAGYSATDLYNLGNAYARGGKAAMAVLNYERAGLLAPGDPDIEANLRFVRETAKVPAAAPSWFERALTSQRPTLLYWSGLFGILLVGCCLLVGRTTSRYRWLRRLGMVIGVALAGVTVCNAWFLWPRLHDAVVLNAATPARVSPVPMGDPLFTLPEAQTVSITARHEGFLLVRTRAGKVGWVAAASVAPVVPGP